MCRYVLIKALPAWKRTCASAGLLSLFPFILYSLLPPFNSPFKVMSQPGHDASKVRASGPGLDTKGVPASLPVEFTIDARDAGEGLLTVQILVSAAARCGNNLSHKLLCLTNFICI